MQQPQSQIQDSGHLTLWFQTHYTVEHDTALMVQNSAVEKSILNIHQDFVYKNIFSLIFLGGGLECIFIYLKLLVGFIFIWARQTFVQIRLPNSFICTQLRKVRVLYLRVAVWCKNGWMYWLQSLASTSGQHCQNERQYYYEKKNSIQIIYNLGFIVSPCSEQFIYLTDRQTVYVQHFSKGSISDPHGSLSKSNVSEVLFVWRGKGK